MTIIKECVSVQREKNRKTDYLLETSLLLFGITSHPTMKVAQHLYIVSNGTNSTVSRGHENC